MITAITVHLSNLWSSQFRGHCIGLCHPSTPAPGKMWELSCCLTPPQATYAPFHFFPYLFPLSLSFPRTPCPSEQYPAVASVTSRATSSVLLVWAIPTASSWKGGVGACSVLHLQNWNLNPIPTCWLDAWPVSAKKITCLAPALQTGHGRGAGKFPWMWMKRVCWPECCGRVRTLDLAVGFRTRLSLQAVPGGCFVRASKP